jgi:hypothetical protein
LVAGAVASVLAAAGWASVTYATHSTWRVLAVLAGALVGFAVRRFAPERKVNVGLGIAAGSLAFASVTLGWVLTVTALIAHANGVSFLAAWRNIGSTNSGWAGALPFEDLIGWALLGLAGVTGFYVARLPPGGGALALEGLNAMPGIPPSEPLYLPAKPPSEDHRPDTAEPQA